MLFIDLCEEATEMYEAHKACILQIVTYGREVSIECPEHGEVLITFPEAPHEASE